MISLRDHRTTCLSRHRRSGRGWKAAHGDKVKAPIRGHQARRGSPRHDNTVMLLPSFILGRIPSPFFVELALSTLLRVTHPYPSHFFVPLLLCSIYLIHPPKHTIRIIDHDHHMQFLEFISSRLLIFNDYFVTTFYDHNDHSRDTTLHDLNTNCPC